MFSTRLVMSVLLASSILGGGMTLPVRSAHAGGSAHVAGWVAKAKKVGVANDKQDVHILLYLQFRNLSALKNLIKTQYTIGSDSYGKYLTPEEFRARFAPEAKNVDLVKTTLQNLGFTVESTPKSGLFVAAVGTVKQVKAAFGVSQALYSYRGKILRANAEVPTIPSALTGIVTHIAGLDDTRLLKKSYLKHIDDIGSVDTQQTALTVDAKAKRMPFARPPAQSTLASSSCSTYWNDHAATLSTAPGPYPAKLPWLMCGYTPQQILSAYGAANIPQTGSGVKIGVVDIYASPTIFNDVNTYSANHKLPLLTATTFQQIVPSGLFSVPNKDPCGPGNWYQEETLDIEAVHSIAPNAAITFAGDTCTDPGNTALYNLIDNHTVDIVTNSYGLDGEPISPDQIDVENQYFMQAAAEGMTILFSSGDNGDVANGPENPPNGIASGSWEATSPYVTAVGGTSLGLLTPSGTKLEWGWGTYRSLLNAATVSKDGQTITTTGSGAFSYYGGSGGGPSLSQLGPDYQTTPSAKRPLVPYSLSTQTTLADGTAVPLEAPHRVVPDISMVADPYTGFIVGETFTISHDPSVDTGCKVLSKTTEYCEVGTGGTSLSSPLMAGVIALVNEARATNGKKPIGFANPALYALTVGTAGNTAAPIIDVNRPAKPIALLRGYLTDSTKVRVVTINSVPDSTNTTVKLGYDTSYRTSPGYDEVTGLGTPNIPAFIKALSN